MAELQRRSYSPPVSRAGRGWMLTCSSCGRDVETGPGVVCSHCGFPAVEQLPVVVEPGRPTPLALRRPLLLPFCLLLALGPALPLTAMMASESLLAALIMFPILYLLLFPVTVPFTFLARWLYRRVHPVVENGARLFDLNVHVTRVWVDLTKLRGRRGLVLNVSLRAAYLQGRRLEVVVRLRGPDGRYLRSDLRNYRGELGEVRARFSTQPVQNMVAVFERIWMFLPVRALGLPPGTREVHLTAEVLVGCDGVVQAEVDHPVFFRPLPEDFPHLLGDGASPRPEAPGADDLDPGAVEFLVVGVDAAADARQCGVCGDPLAAAGPTVACSLCESPHHQECWEYLGGCSTYACEGRPVER